MGTEIEVNEGDDGESVLAEAAVQSAAVSGAAAAMAGAASHDAEKAEAKADQANDAAGAALTVAASKPSSEEVDAKIAAAQAEILAAIAALKDVQVDSTLEVKPVVEAPKDTAPKSVEEPKEKKSWYDRYIGDK
jgi:hypothetical protein